MTLDRIRERTIAEIINAFLSIGYRTALVKRNYDFSDFLSVDPTLRTISLAVFGQEPMDYRSACFGLEFASEISSEIVANQLRALGAPQIFLIQNGSAQWWINREKEVVFKENIKTSWIAKLVEDHAEDWKPEAIMRIKSGFKVPMPQQLDFIDLGLLPALEHKASLKIDSLIGRILYNAEKGLKMEKIPFNASPVFNVVFRLLTAKLLKDRDIPITPKIDFSNPLSTLKAVSGYYGEKGIVLHQAGTLPESLLCDIAYEIHNSFSLRNLSVDTLAYVYENTFVSQKSRKKLGIHSTPSYIADYVMAQMPIEDLPRSQWHVLDPMCGHGIFLIAAMRKMRNLVPLDWSGRRRHNFFSERLHGIEIDPFSVEVARLCLTLADFPESDGWDLRVEDAFKGKSLNHLAEKTSIFVGNPPFEVIEGMKTETPKPKEILNRILLKIHDKALVGFVLPYSFLDGADYRAERKLIQDTFEIINITTLPDRIFKYSEAETAIIIAKKQSPLGLPKTNYRVVRKADKDQFRLSFKATFEDTIPSSYFKTRMQGRFILPPFREIWERLEGNPKLNDVADIKTGVEYEPGLEPDQLWQDTPFPDSAPGLFKVSKGFKQFVIDSNIYLSTKIEHKRRMVSGAWKFDWQKSKIIVPKSVMSRGPWCFAAAIDQKGLIVRRRFFAIWLKSNSLSIKFITAVLNSPIAQAFAFSFSNKRDIPKRVYGSIPLPLEWNNSIKKIDDLVKDYKIFHKKDEKTAKKILLNIDYEILRLYDLPRKVTVELLKLFSDHKRPVTCGFKGYGRDIISSLNSDSISPEVHLSPEVSDFCDKKDISRYLKTAIAIIKRSFLSIKEMKFIIEQDPEIDDEWLLIDIIVDGTAEELLTSYDKYIEQWVSNAPEFVRDNIKLSYGIF